MKDELKSQLAMAGWKSGTFRGYLLTFRAGIEWEIGPSRGGEGRLTLMYRYRSGEIRREGEETLPEDTDLDRLYDAMTAIYQRVHERPDPSRIFGGGRKRRADKLPARQELPSPPDPAQQTLEL